MLWHGEPKRIAITYFKAMIRFDCPIFLANMGIVDHFCIIGQISILSESQSTKVWTLNLQQIGWMEDSNLNHLVICNCMGPFMFYCLSKSGFACLIYWAYKQIVSCIPLEHVAILRRAFKVDNYGLSLLPKIYYV